MNPAIRFVNPSENGINSRDRPNKTGHRGVYKNRERFSAQIKVNYKKNALEHTTPQKRHIEQELTVKRNTLAKIFISTKRENDYGRSQ